MNNNSLLKEASDIAEKIYKMADEIESSEPDEKWRTVSKLKNSANDAYFYIAQVAGAGKAQSFEFDCVNARKNMSTLKYMYVFACRQGMVELEPEIVLRMEKLIVVIDDEQKLSQLQTKSRSDEELKPRLEKYRIWQKIFRD
jgi:hypothetical protein